MKHHGNFGHELLIPNTFFLLKQQADIHLEHKGCSLYNAVTVHGSRYLQLNNVGGAVRKRNFS
jgi:hypothetical protein